MHLQHFALAFRRLFEALNRLLELVLFHLDVEPDLRGG